MARVALVTCKVLPEPDPDEAPLVDALRDAGLDAHLLAWDDPSSDPGRFDLCVLRSCWNYHENPAAFRSWIADAAAVSRLMNPPRVIEWNLHKRYLGELERAGLPVVPTAGFARGESADLRILMGERGWGEVVVKPAISAASFRTRRFTRYDLTAGQAFLSALLEDRDALVQRCMPTFDDPGERALVWIDGELTHAVIKSPRFADGEERVSDAVPVTDDERDLTGRAIALVSDELLYARVDVIDDGEGGRLISELELMEPSLFLMQNASALERFVSAIHRRCPNR